MILDTQMIGQKAATSQYIDLLISTWLEEDLISRPLNLKSRVETIAISERRLAKMAQWVKALHLN